MTLKFSDESVGVITFCTWHFWKTREDSLPVLDHITALRLGSNYWLQLSQLSISSI